MKKLLAGLAITASVAIAPTAAFAAGKHAGSASQMGCSLSASGVGSALTLSGSGYTPGATYIVDWVWPNGNGEAASSVTADPSGNISTSLYANWAGSYTDNVLFGGKQVASCSTTVS